MSPDHNDQTTLSQPSWHDWSHRVTDSPISASGFGDLAFSCACRGIRRRLRARCVRGSSPSATADVESGLVTRDIDSRAKLRPRELRRFQRFHPFSGNPNITTIWRICFRSNRNPVGSNRWSSDTVLAQWKSSGARAMLGRRKDKNAALLPKQPIVGECGADYH